jgi:hypothetical protein
MKKFIQQKNLYLLEHHPTLWNTKMIWMLAASLILHLLFFIAGFLSLMNPETLQEYRTIENFFSNGVVLLGILVSVLLLVIWMISMFRNNAFKNFYPFTRLKLFKHFISYFVIFLASTTFYYSFTLGMQSFTHITYDNERMKSDITLINKGMPLLPFDLTTYELDRLRQPAPFDTLYCATSNSSVDVDQPYHEFKGQKYQFYTLEKRTRLANTGIIEQPYYLTNHVFRETVGTQEVYYLKDQVVFPELPFNNAAPSFYNFSDLFHESDFNDNYYTDDLYYKSFQTYDFNKLTPQRIQQIQVNQELLLSGEKNIAETLEELLQVVSLYKIKNNIDVKDWVSRQSYQQPFTISELIEDGKSAFKKNRYQNIQNENEFSLYTYDLRKSSYFDATSLRRSLNNIEELKTSNIFEGSLHVFLWLAFGFSVIVFMFRVTGLKPLLLSVVSMGVIALVTALLGIFIGYLVSFSSGSEYFAFTLVFIVSTAILIATLGYAHRFRKLISGILMNITMVGFVPYLLLIVGFISAIQSDLCPYSYDDDLRENCNILWDVLGVYWSYVFLILGVSFMFWFCKKLMFWRAMPEG